MTGQPGSREVTSHSVSRQSSPAGWACLLAAALLLLMFFLMSNQLLASFASHLSFSADWNATSFGHAKWIPSKHLLHAMHHRQSDPPKR